ncbi:MAG: GNAT family N-acetyltransferase [Myxococcota bacterium]
MSPLAEVNGIAIRRIKTPQDVSRWRPGFVGTYQTVFSGHPYYERFYPSEAEGVYQRLVGLDDSIVLVATRGNSQVVALAAAVPLAQAAPVANHLTGLVPVAHSFYLAELGVLERFRGLGIGRALVRERLRLIDEDRYSHVVLRVSTSHNPSKAMYEAMGFEDMGVQQQVSAMRTDGKVRTDTRIFLAKVLSQVDLP